MKIIKYQSIYLIGLVLITACGSKPATASPLPITATIEASPTLLPVPSETPLPLPLPTATPLVIGATLKVQVNVRSGPGTAYDSLGLLDAGEVVDVLAQSADGAWFAIIYPAGPAGLGWVSAQYVDTDDKIVPSQTPQVTPTASGPTGTVSQRLNVRSGPGTEYDTLGILEPDVVVTLLGKNEIGSWLQIAYPGASDGIGWVTAAWLRLDSTIGLPVLNALGTPITPVALASTPSPGVLPTPTISPAMADGDSAVIPLVSVLFAADGTQRFGFQGDVSIPQGDPEDWIEFTPYSLPGRVTTTMIASLVCSGNGTLVVELWQDGEQVPNWGSLACGSMEQGFFLPVNGSYLFHFYPAAGSDLQYVNYYLRLGNKP